MCNSLRITVKLTPKAAKNEIQGWSKGIGKEKILKCTVTAVPEKEKANKALIALLAKAFSIPKNKFSIVHGEKTPIKIIEIQGVKKILPQTSFHKN